MPPFHIVLLFGFGEHPAGFIVALAILLALGRMLFSIFRDGFEIAQAEVIKSGEMTYSHEERSAVSFQLSNFSYFRKLTQKGKDEFIRRTLNFIRSHTIEGQGDFNPSLPEKIHVSAAATQLTFGLKDFFFSHFETVILYPTTFRMRPEGPLMKGAATPNGVIRISLKDFDAGYANPTDKLNVGLHEFGHGLFMEFLKRANDDHGNQILKDNLYRYIEESDRMLADGKHNDLFLRDYAFTNRHEFFAVSIEHFFEVPKEFKENLPKLYDTLKILLKQDPASELPDYGIVRK